MRIAAVAAALLLVAGCGDEPAVDEPAGELALDDGGDQGEPVEDIEVAGPLVASDGGATPMAERVATLGIMNKRNGISRDIELSPGQSARVGDALIQLRACETTAPWEPQTLTGAFIRVFTRDVRADRRCGATLAADLLWMGVQGAAEPQRRRTSDLRYLAQGVRNDPSRQRAADAALVGERRLERTYVACARCPG